MVWLFATLGLAALLLHVLPWLLRRRPAATAASDLKPSGPDPDYEIEIGRELDLHGVDEAEVEALVEAFIAHAVDRGWVEVKIIHGKGTGRRRARVRARLAQLPGVIRFGDATSPGSGWGATVVFLAPPSSEVAPPAPAD